MSSDIESTAAARPLQIVGDGTAFMHRSVSLSVEEAERQYSPSRWSKRFEQPDDVVKDYVDKCVAGSMACVEQLKDCMKTYDYDIGSNEKVIVVSPTAHGIAGCNILAFIHGGYWSFGSFRDALYPARAFTSQGLAYAAIGYDLAPKMSMAGIVGQVKNAVKLLLAVALHSGAKGLYLAGSSAGAHLAAMMMYVDWDAELGEGSRTLTSLLKGIILISGIFDLTPILPTYINEPLKMDSVAAEAFSPALLMERGAAVHPSIRSCRILVVVAENDSPAFHTQSRRFYELLREMVDAAEYVVIPDTDHFDIVTGLEDAQFILTKTICTFISGWLV